MRLNVHSYKKEKPAAKKSSAKKKVKKPKLSKNYTSMNEYKGDRGEIMLKNLTYGTINSHKLKYVVTDEETIILKDSWIEFIILMIYNVMENNPDNFKKTLGEYGVLGNEFKLDTMYGNYSFDINKQYKVYQVYNTKYYLEAVFSNDVIFEKMSKLMSLCGLAYDGTYLGIERCNLVKVENEDNICDFSSSTLGKNYSMPWVKIFLKNEWVEIHSESEALYLIVNWVQREYGDAGLMKIKSVNNTGLGLVPTDKSMVISNTSFYINTDENKRDIYKFIHKLKKTLEIASETIRIEFKEEG